MDNISIDIEKPVLARDVLQEQVDECVSAQGVQ